MKLKLVAINNEFNSISSYTPFIFREHSLLRRTQIRYFYYLWIVPVLKYFSLVFIYFCYIWFCKVD